MMMSLPGYSRERIASMVSGCGVGVSVTVGVAVTVGVKLGAGVALGGRVSVPAIAVATAASTGASTGPPPPLTEHAASTTISSNPEVQAKLRFLNPSIAKDTGGQLKFDIICLIIKSWLPDRQADL